MKRLYLLRHATAADGAASDFDRPLTHEGREESERVGAFMRKKAIEIDCVLCSPSVRTRETWNVVAKELRGGAPQAFYPERLYKEGEDAIYEEIGAAPGECDRLLVIGHNPGLELFARSLADAKSSRPKPLRRLLSNFPKAAFARYKLDIEGWDDIQRGIGRLTLFRTPKDLQPEPWLARRRRR